MVIRPFDTLTPRGQVRRLRTQALRGLSAFPLTPRRVKLVHHGENTTFRVDADEGRFLLRLHRPGYHDAAEIRAELRWITALGRDTDLRVAVPLAARDGALVQTVVDPGVPEPRDVSVLTWVHGRFRGETLMEEQTRAMGHVLGTLHRHAREHSQDAAGVRPLFDVNGIAGPGAVMGPVEALPRLTPKERELVAAARERLHAGLDPLFENTADVGLVHADLHGWNVLFHDAGASPIDFDDCGHSLRHYDLAICFNFLRWWTKRFPRTGRALLDGYAAHFAIGDADLRAIRLMGIARKLWGLGWLASRSDVPALRARIPRRRKAVAGDLRAFLADEDPPVIP